MLRERSIKMEIQQRLLTINPYSRPCKKIGPIKNIVVHWVGNAASTAIANRNYFESLKEKKSFASSHYIIGLQGEIIQCVPESEVAYHAKEANSYSIGIEVCHPDWQGKFAESTYNSLISLLVDLCKRYSLEPTQAIIRHYDVTKKECPRYYVQNTKAWLQLKDDVKNAMVGVDDLELKRAAELLHKRKIISVLDVWSDMSKFKLEYVPGLLKNMGGIDRLVKDKIITDRLLWEHKLYKQAHVRSLIIKYSKLG